MRSPQDESVPAHPELNPAHPLVVFGDHRFCAGSSDRVMRMPGPHMHSQIEFNFVLDGRMTYWFDGRELTVSAGRLVLFWGMIPHQVIELDEPTHFVCLYVPMSVFLGLPSLSSFREAVFRGAMIEALDIKSYDHDIFRRWRDELLSRDTALEQIVRDELTARVRRLDREGWRDLRQVGEAMNVTHHGDGERIVHVECMARFISENALEAITVEHVARAVNLHTNYAMTIYKRAVGLTINQSIVRQRLDTAQSLLIATDMPIANVAFESGFGSLSRFYEAFAQRFGSQPGAFRRRLAQASRQIDTGRSNFSRK
ncbi:helix-turn-helix domain-containing protein [Rhizobiales bacterium 3FA27D7]|jgi:AraC-like DNA-binding protein|uniref:helix-turn-helix domain-containing protein n=1 Tax=Mesorhizobium sp. 2RAF21 TaxID=3232995 RepID=UPI0010F90286